MLRYPWAEARAALEALAARPSPSSRRCRCTYVNPETGADAQNILGYYALMLRPGQTLTLPVRSPATVFHLIEGAREVQQSTSRASRSPRPTPAARRATRAVTLRNASARNPAFFFIADETPLHASSACTRSAAESLESLETSHDPTYLWTPPPVQSLPVHGSTQRLPVNRLFFVGRNYHAHAVEMGRPVDKAVEPPFYFTKSPQTLVESGATVRLSAARRRTTTTRWNWWSRSASRAFASAEPTRTQLVYGYACGLDMTRRDLQLAARDKGRPWDLGKDVEQSSVVVGDRADARHRARARRAGADGQRPAAAAVRPRQADLERPRADRRPVAASTTCSPAT